MVSLTLQALPQAAYPSTVGQFDRTMFAELTSDQAIPNPFGDVKLHARFVHQATGRAFQMPVVHYEERVDADTDPPTPPRHVFQVWFFPPLTGNWTWHMVFSSGASWFTSSTYPTVGAPASFSCVPSAKPGPWRVPADPALRFTIEQPWGNGHVTRPWPLSTTFLEAFWPGHPISASMSSLNWAASRGFNRVRVYLTQVANRDQDASGHNFTVFQKLPTSNPNQQFQPINIAFERFDLSQWSIVDGVLAAASSMGLQVYVNLTFNVAGFDYEDEYLATAPPYPNPLPTRTPTTSSSGFSTRSELYYWYAVGRLSSFPNVQYSLMHEHDVGPPLSTDSWKRPYPNTWVRSFGSEFAAIEPYLVDSPSSRVLTTLPARGSLYSGPWDGTPMRQVPPETYPEVTDDNLLSRRQSAFVGSQDLWMSALGLQRGGEIGTTSISAAEPILYPAGFGGNSFPTVHTSHRQLLTAAGTQRPIFIEEDWISKNTAVVGVERLPAPSFDNFDNPYCYWHNAAGTEIWNDLPLPPGQSWHPILGYQRRFLFLSCPPSPPAPACYENERGIMKFWRDATWMCGMISQGYLNWWGPAWSGNLGTPVYTSSWVPLQICSEWAAKNPWWKLSPDQSRVVAQIPPPPTFRDHGWQPGSPERPVHELKATLAHGLVHPFEELGHGYLAYCPMASALSLDLAELVPNIGVDYYFMNPVTGERSSGTITVGNTGVGSITQFPLPPATSQAEFGEYVLVIGFPIEGGL